jgi:NADH-quinone oxidoreductase subunit N
VVGGQLDPFTAINAYSSALYYTVAYVLMSLGAFGMVLLLSRAGYEAENLEDFKGLNKRSPWFAAMMLIIMFSMAGIPFFIGFFAKFAVLLAAVKAGYTAVAVIAVMFSLIGAFYYLRVVKLMYFDAPVDSAPITAGLDCASCCRSTAGRGGLRPLPRRGDDGLHHRADALALILRYAAFA